MAALICWLDARDATKHPTVPRMDTHSKVLSTPNINGAEVEKPYSKEQENG